jgi:hypothetical protein
MGPRELAHRPHELALQDGQVRWPAVLSEWSLVIRPKLSTQLESASMFSGRMGVAM